MRNTVTAVATVLFCLVVLPVLPLVSAESGITVEVDGEGATDGETVVVGPSPLVNVTVESDTTLASVRTGTDGSFSINGADAGTYRSARNVTVPNEEEFRVEATEVSGETYSHTVVLARPSETARGIQRDVRSIRNEVESIEKEVDRLEDRRDELRRRNENLTQLINETRQKQNASQGGEEGERTPGFTAVVAAFAFLLYTAVRSE